ncbi:MAG: hypothetical protein H6651_12210 [Ardenticatenales bacterium]|nr:hypothetical protein [Ardenticatenales bacterium]
MISCVTVPYFAATMEQRDDEALSEKPVVIGGSPWEIRPLFAYSRQVARLGVGPGMSLRRAHFLSPEAHFLPTNRPRYQDQDEALSQLLLDFSDEVEPEALWQEDEAFQAHQQTVGGRTLPARYYLDLDGLPLSEALPLAQHLGRTLRQQFALPPAIGLAEDRFTAQVAAALARPNHALPVEPGREEAFLTGRSIHFLPLDLETDRRLRLLGIRSLGQLAKLPASAIPTQFGSAVKPFHKQARGQDATPVQPLTPAQAISNQQSFPEPIYNSLTLAALLNHIAAELAADLSATLQVCAEIELLWQTEAGDYGQKSVSLREPTSHAAHLGETAKEMLFKKPLRAGIVYLQLTLRGLRPAAAAQLNLFDPAGQVQASEPWSELLRDLSAKFGADLFYRPVAIDINHPLPERRGRLQPLSA